LKINKEGERRSYSIASTPDNNHGVSIVVEILGNGKGSTYLRELEIGTEIEMMAPMGQFVIEEGGEKKMLFVATGSGIVPIFSMINDLLINKKETRPMRLHWGMRSEEDLFWFDNIERLAEEHPNFVFDQVLSRASENWSLCTGHVQDCLVRDLSEEGMGEWEAYVCGSKVVVETVSETLVKLGMKRDDIYHEKFS